MLFKLSTDAVSLETAPHNVNKTHCLLHACLHSTPSHNTVGFLCFRPTDDDNEASTRFLVLEDLQVFVDV